MTMFYIKKILKHTAFYGISNLFVSLTSFLLIPILTRCLRPEEYGVYSLVAVFGTVVFYVYDMGMLHALVRYFAEVSHDKPEEGRRIASTVLWFLVIVSAVFSMILLSNSGRISYLMLGAKKYIFLIQLTVAVVFFNTVTGVSTTLLRIKERSNLFMWFFGLKGIGTIGLTFVFLVLLRRGLLGVFESMLLVAAVFLILLFVFTFREYRFSFSLSYLAQMIRFGLPLCPAMFFGWVIDFSDRYLVRYFLSLSDVGLYSLGYKISQIVFMIVMAFVMCWHPLIFNIIK